MACARYAVTSLRSAPVLSLIAGVAISTGACTGDRGGGSLDMSPHPPGDLDVTSPRTCTLTGTPHQLSNLTGQHAYPRIASNGVGYIVAWLSGMPGSPPTYRIDASLTDRQGNKLGPNLPMSPQPVAEADPPSVAPIAGGTTIAWTRRAGAGTDIAITTLDISGQKLDVMGQPCDPADLNCGIFPVTSSGLARTPFLERPFFDQHTTGATENQLGLAFVDSRNYPCATAPCADANDVFWKRVQTNGTELLFEKQLTMMHNARYASPRLAFDGFHQGVVWRDTTAPAQTDLYFTTIDNLGQISSSILKIGSVSGADQPTTPDLVWTGDEYAVASASGTDATATILFQRQSPTGTTTLMPKGVTFEGSTCAPAIAFDGNAYAIVYQESCGQTGSDLEFIRVSSDGTRLKLDGSSCGDSVDPACGRLTIATSDREGASHPEMVFGGDNSFAIVWMQGTQGFSLQPDVPLEVYFQRVDCD
jgi:hypothetical protein